jgi:uncharacterized protein (TIGR00645 family)
MRDFIEGSVERLIFASRWLLAPFYLGLVGAVLVLLFKFCEMFFNFAVRAFELDSTAILLAVLNLIDYTLLANLMILVIFSGYENFVSKITIAENSPDRPEWMGEVDFAGLKLKLIGSIVALSAINLLGAFFNLKDWTSEQLAWMVGIHLAFVFTAVMFALSEKIGIHGVVHKGK